MHLKLDFKLMGGILLIVGTSIGAGMLALPIATAQLGFLGSLIMLIVCWFIMTSSAFLLLEVNLWMRQNSNLITMAKSTLGPLGQGIAWLTYLLLLYSLLAAYISGGSDLFHQVLTSSHATFPKWGSVILFTLFFGAIVALGIRSVDYVNRGLMLIKFGSLFLLMGCLYPMVTKTNLFRGDFVQLTSPMAMMVTITSFGYATIIPSLRVYFHQDVRQLKKAILIGSLIPLTCYILWDLAIMGLVPLEGGHSLTSILHSENATSSLVTVLIDLVSNESIALFVRIFTSICVLTSFLGVSLGLSDFLADGVGLEKKGWGLITVQLLTFLPPLLAVLFLSNIFMKGLAYAGVYCLILLVLLPACMAWSGRYRLHLPSSFTARGGKGLLVGLIVFSLSLIGWGIWSS